MSAFVASAIQNYSLVNLEDFQSTLYYSKLVRDIDNAHPSIVSNQTDYVLMKKLIPTVNVPTNYSIVFNTQLYVPETAIPLQYTSVYDSAIYSSQFVYNNLSVQLADDGKGNVRLVQQTTAGTYSTISIVGTIDYVTGTIRLSSFSPSSYTGDAIRIYANIPDAIKDFTSQQNVILEIPNDEIKVTIQQVRI